MHTIRQTLHSLVALLVFSGCGRAEKTQVLPPDVVEGFVGEVLAPGGENIEVVAELTVSTKPDCTRGDDLEYGFFVDVDPFASPRTGVTGGALEGLGADLRIPVRCEGGRLVSPAGDVSLALSAGESGAWTIAVSVPSASLPELFDWIAYARVAGEVSRVPSGSDVGHKSPREDLRR